jgi:acyl carrier protein
MKRHDVIQILRDMLKRREKPDQFDEDTPLASLGLDSMDFSELAVRVEMQSGRTLVFSAAPIRAVQTVRDILDFMMSALGDANTGL